MSTEEKTGLITARQAGIAVTKATTDTATVMSTIAQAKEKGFNVLTPATLSEQLPPGHSFSIRIVSPRGERDFYSTGRGKYAPSGKLLDKIAQAAGIRWRVDLFNRLDDRREPYYCIYEAVGVAPDPATGEPRMMKGTKAIDLRDGSPLCEEMLENAQNSQYNKTPEDAEKAAAKAIRQKRKFINELAETGARLRVIRALMSIDSDFNAKEITMDFVIVSIDANPVAGNPEEARRHAEESRKLRESMYYGIGAAPGRSEASAAPALVSAPPQKMIEIEQEPERRARDESPEIPNFDENEPWDDDDIPFGN